MKRYSEYKDSGVEWIGEIPSHWEVKKLKYISNIYTGGTPPKSNEKNYENGYIPWVKPANIIHGGCVDLDTKEKITSIGLKDAPLIEKDSTIVCCIGTIGKTGFNNSVCTTNQQINSIVFDTSYTDKKYGFYAIIASEKEHNALSNKVVVSILNKNQQENIKIAVPPIYEQDIIVNFLDKKTAQIETLIGKKEELIEMLKASRTKLISETVTKGLDKDVTMKDSGIEWIGEIPSHYELKKLKNICNHIGRGKSPEYEENTGTYTVNQACLYWNYFKSENIKSVSNKFYNSLNSTQKINNGDILINSTGGGNLGKSAFFDKTGTLGRVHFYEGEENYAYDSHVTMVRLKETYNKKYFYYMFCTKNVHNYIDLFCVNGSTKQIELSKTGLESIIIPVPSKEEQDEISNYLDEKTLQIDSLVAKIEEQIEILNKAKQKLITEVVTGKIDVTNL